MPGSVAPHHSARAVAEALSERRADLETFVRRRVAPQDVDDVLQLAALRAVERAESLDDPDRAVAWIYRIHRNLIIDTHRKRARERSVVDHNAELPDVVEMVLADRCECSVTQSQRLRPTYASILSLVDHQGLPVVEAARRLDVSANNANVRLHRARKALRDAMLEHCGVEDPRECASCRCIEEACCAA